MSQHGSAPWANDTGADWCGYMMDNTQLARYVRTALSLPCDELFKADMVRAAVGILIALGHTYLWPVDDLDEDLQLGKRRLEELLPFWKSSPTYAVVEREIEVLQARIDLLPSKVDAELSAKLWQVWLGPAES